MQPQLRPKRASEPMRLRAPAIGLPVSASSAMTSSTLSDIARPRQWKKSWVKYAWPHLRSALRTMLLCTVQPGSERQAGRGQHVQCLQTCGKLLTLQLLSDPFKGRVSRYLLSPQQQQADYLLLLGVSTKWVEQRSEPCHHSVVCGHAHET